MLYTDEAIKKRKKKAKMLKNISSVIVYIVLVPLLIYNVFLIIQAVVNPKKTPSFFGIKTYAIISGSMEPELKIGDIVIAKELNNELKEGDIISFRQGQSIITHRIFEVIKNRDNIEYKTKGDNNNTADSGTITKKIIEGKVIAKIPFVGKISILLKKKVVIVAIIVIFYMYLLYTKSIKKRKNTRKLKRIKHEKQNIQWSDNDI